MNKAVTHLYCYAIPACFETKKYAKTIDDTYVYKTAVNFPDVVSAFENKNFKRFLDKFMAIIYMHVHIASLSKPNSDIIIPPLDLFPSDGIQNIEELNKLAEKCNIKYESCSMGGCYVPYHFTCLFNKAVKIHIFFVNGNTQFGEALLNHCDHIY